MPKNKQLRTITKYCGQLTAIFMFALLPTWPAQSEITSTNALVSATSNGVPVVHISAPSAQGISNNAYSAFNIDAKGAILNNSITSTNSVLANGAIDRNAIFQVTGTAPAKIIINAVTGSKSNLNGLLEIAGTPAELVVANPYGIDCLNCGFINTPKATLLTGKPVSLNNLPRYFEVQGGTININGMNASDSIVNLLTGTLTVDGAVNAAALNAIVGSNLIKNDKYLTYTETQDAFTMPSTFKGMSFKALSNIQSGKIYLIETMGNPSGRVNTSGAIDIKGNLTSSGGITISSPGSVYISGSSTEKINLKAGTDSWLDIYAGNAISLSRINVSAGSFQLQGTYDGSLGYTDYIEMYDSTVKASRFSILGSIDYLELNRISVNVLEDVSIQNFRDGYFMIASLDGEIGRDLVMNMPSISIGTNNNDLTVGGLYFKGGDIGLYGKLTVVNDLNIFTKRASSDGLKLNAKNVLIAADNSINIKTSNIVAKKSINFTLGDSINIDSSSIHAEENITILNNGIMNCLKPGEQCQSPTTADYVSYPVAQPINLDNISNSWLKAGGAIVYESSKDGISISARKGYTHGSSKIEANGDLLINAKDGFVLLDRTTVNAQGATYVSSENSDITHSIIDANSVTLVSNRYSGLNNSNITSKEDLLIIDNNATYLSGYNPNYGDWFNYTYYPCQVIMCGGSLSSENDVVVLSGGDLKFGTYLLPASGTNGTAYRLPTKISAGKNVLMNTNEGIVNLDGTYINAGGGIVLSGQSVGIFGPANINFSRTQSGNTTTTIITETDVPASINAHDDISILARGNANGATEADKKGNVLINGSEISALNGHISITAANDIDVSNDVTTDTYYQAYYRVKKRTFSSTRETRITSSTDQTLIPSLLAAQTISLAAGHDLTVVASDIQATGSIGLHADHNFDLLSTAEIDSNYSFYQLSKSGVFGSNGGFGFTVGKRVLTQTSTETTQTQLGASVSSLLGDINFSAGNQFTQMSSEILAPVGSIGIAAKEVAIATNNNTYSLLNTLRIKQTGFTLSAGHPLISSYNQLMDMKKATERTKNGHTQALAALTSALTLNTAYKIYNEPEKFSNKDVYDPAYAQTMGRWSLSASLGTSTYSNESFTYSSLPVESSILAGRHVSIEATGQASQSQGDITISGAAIQAGGGLSLSAADEITLLAAKAIQVDTTREQSTATSIGFSVSAQGAAATFAASRMRGFTNGRSTTYYPVELTAGLADSTGLLSLTSGTNTNIQGATLSGYQVSAHVGSTGSGNLLMLSPQDESFYEGDKKSWGVNVSIPIGSTGNATFGLNYSKMKLLADYQSAKEQTAIRAGDGGFQINVNGDTRLDGAVMNSTASSNTLTTQTLKLTDLENKENVSGSSSNLTLSYTNPQVATGNFGGTTYGFADIDRFSLSHTKAAIVAGATLNITRPDLQTQSVASLNRDVNAAHQPLAPTFDARQATAELETGAATMAAFTRAGYEFAGSYSQDQIKKSDDLRKLAGDSTLPAAVRDQYLAEADQLLKTWGNGGVGRAALHALVGGTAWGSVGALASAGNVLSEPYRDTAVDTAMRAVGLDPSTNPGLKNTLMFASSTALGSALGGAQGAAATFSADANNRQLHETENRRIKELAKGDATKEIKLTQAACYLVKCADGVPTDDPRYPGLLALQNAGANLSAEQALLQQQHGLVGRAYQPLFTYHWQDGLIDAATQTRLGTRLAGAAMWVGGALGTAGSGTLCTTGIGCVGAAVVGTVSLDVAQTGYGQMVTGNARIPMGEQVIASLGLSPQAAALAYATMGLTPLAVEALVANKTFEAMSKANEVAKATYANFQTKGLAANFDVMSTPQAQALIREMQAGSPSMSAADVIRYASNYIESGVSLPQQGIASAGATLVKVVPKGEAPSLTTGFWMTPQQAQAMSGQSAQVIADTLALPLAQAQKIQQVGADYFAITAKAGTKPTIFMSDIAKASQGSVQIPGGKVQFIVPNRSLWTDAVKINPVTLRPIQ